MSTQFLDRPPPQTDQAVGKKKTTKPPRPGVPLHVWLEPWLRDAIEAVRRKNRRSLREEVSIALEAHAATHGFFPPAEDREGGK